ncbi:hypothetical protein RB195_007107 [Necator americanus]|uniref:Katanin p80 subunit C-terminal domain-containing protein n=1 Tax=Necator americanus TaxID=51031 RepID=A0ABR1BVN1_NECAM
MKTYEIVAPSKLFAPPSHAVLSTRSRCVFVANPLTVHSLLGIDSEVPTIPFSGHVDCLRLSADERNIGIASNDLIKLVDLTRGREIRNLSGHSLAVRALTPRWSSVYSWVSGSLDSSWIIWDSRSHPANILQGRTTGPVRCVELSPDDIILAVGTDSTLQLFDIRQRCSLKQFPSSTHGATFHPSQRMVATYGPERVVRYWCLDEFISIAMSDVFASEIRCARFVSPSCPGIDPVLVASTDEFMKTLTSEPCETLSTNNIGESKKVLNMHTTADGVGVVCCDTNSAVSYAVFSMEEVLCGPGSVAPDFSEDEDESLSDGMTSLMHREDSSAPAPFHLQTASSAHMSRVDDSASVGNVRANSIPVRSTSSGRNTPAPVRFRPQVDVSERRTHSERSLATRPRSPSMPTVHTTAEAWRESRVTSRSISPANGITVKEAPNSAPRSLEKTSRPAGGRPPRELRRTVHPMNSNDGGISSQQKNSPNGLSLCDFVAKTEKEHYMAVMQAEKTALGVQQLVASLKHGGVSAMLKDGIFADELAVTAMLRMLNEKKRWDINICNSYLGKLKELLFDNTLPSSCRQVALSSLQCIATGLVDSLRNCARAPLSTIGVDVAAEERKAKAENCLKELRDLRDRREQFYRRLSQEDIYRLDAIMVFLKPL